MNYPFMHKASLSLRTINRALVAAAIVIVVGSAFWAAQVTQAEFEVPLVDTTDFVPTEFRSIWVYNRQVDYSSTQSFKNYEGFAVGKPAQSENGSSALYKYIEKSSGPLWVKMFPQGAKIISPNYQLNAVAGHSDTRYGYATVFIVGRQGGANRQAYLIPLENYPVDKGSYLSDPLSVGRVILDNYSNPFSPITAYFLYPGAGPVANNAIPYNSELYAVGSFDTTAVGISYLAGGENGWLATQYQWLTLTCADNFHANTSATCGDPLGTPVPYQGSWKLFRFTSGAANVPGTNDNITGITYVDENTAYVTTSTFPLVDPLVPGVPKSPYERDCSGNQTSKLFRVSSSVLSPVNIEANWVKVIPDQTGECFYGLSPTRFDQPSVVDGLPNGPLKTEIWIASSKGIRRITDDGSASPPNTLVKDTTDLSNPDNILNRAIYGVATSYERTGQGQQLLLNGDLQAWKLGLGGTNATNPNNEPSGWNFSPRDRKWSLSPDAADGTPGTCNQEALNVEQFPVSGPGAGTVPASGTGAGTDWGVKIEKPLYFLESNPGASTCTGGVVPSDANIPSEVSQVIKLSNVEGTRYRISGSYKVNATTSTRQIWLNNPPIIRQGGVITRCVGGVSGTVIDCPFSNTQELRTLTGPADPGMADYKTFSFDLTRAFNQLQSPIATNALYPRANSNSYYLQVVCTGSYGVRVVCNNLKVEEISDPVQSPTSIVKVIGVGRDGLTLRNDDAVGMSTTWTIDDASLMVPLAGSRTTLNSIFNAGGSHIFAAGSGTSLFQRSVGNVSGYAWLGAAQPGTTGLGGLGWLSTNCANLRDSSQRSLCQRQSQSYGLSLDKTSTGSIALTGRAWLAKQISTGGTNTDNEGLDLGTCEKPARLSSIPATQPYDMTGSCNVTTRTCTQNTTRACFRDFDCYGRCTGDQGYLCLSDNDCSATNVSANLQNSNLLGPPALNLLCNNTLGSYSPNACSAGGWLTLNASDLPGANTPPGAPGFGVTLDQSTGGLSGWGRFMTPAAGQCTTSATDNTPRGKTCTVNTDCADVAGSTCLASQAGWVKFRGTLSNPTAPTAPATTSKIYAAQNCAIPSGNALRCTKDPSNDCSTPALTSTCTSGLGGKCVTMSSCKFGLDQNLQSCAPAPVTCSNFCGGDITKPCTSNTECSSVWGTNDSCKPKGYCSTKLACSNDPAKTCTVATAATDCGAGTCVSAIPSSSCTKDIDCAAGSFCMFGAICTAGAGNSCSTYGIDFDETKGKFQGFAWSSDYGWIDFRAVQKGTNRFLQTRLGDIYSRGNINSNSGALCAGNATYLITATGTINNFCSDLELLDPLPAGVSFIQGGVSAIPFSSASNAFTNALGRFDLTGIETVESGVLNKYKQTIKVLTPNTDGTGSLTYTGAGGLDGTNPIVLNKMVYTADCSSAPGNTCRLTQALRIANAPLGSSGAGILVVKGNLTITNNLQYINSSIDDLRRLASLVIVVRGNLNIENSVTNLVGAYYVDGTVYTSPEATKDSTENHYPLTVRGLMLSKNFIFNRKFAGTVESPLPSELFIFDGRLQSNPLPGMVDFASVLPNTLNSSP